MAKSNHVKEFQAACYRKVHEGLINQVDGTWKEASSSKQMDLDMQAGYRVASRLKRAKKQKAA